MKLVAVRPIWRRAWNRISLDIMGLLVPWKE